MFESESISEPALAHDWNKWMPLQGYLEELHSRLAGVSEGAVADYIPELSLASPDWFGIALVTVDGNVYQVGDARRPFTVQSISKAITYGIALEDNGLEAVFEKVGVEPSGEAFNSISLEPDSGRPFNPMINAGAIAVTGLVKADSPEERFSRILGCFQRYTGQPVTFDEGVYRSERDTGHRNRAIAHMLRSTDIVSGVPEDVLDVYFRQCSIQITARDLALMGACLANSGVNPITGVVSIDRRYVEKVLSVMSTCGMYDYSGSWIFSVGMPAKSGVGGGIMAVLPGQFGLGVFSPPLDVKGNSVRGIRVCEELSRDFGLHLFKVARATSSSVLRVTYDASTVSSKRVHHESEREILHQHGTGVRIYELQGELVFGSTDSVIKTVVESLEKTDQIVLDFGRVVEVEGSSSRLLADFALKIQSQGKQIYFTGTDDKFAFRRYLNKECPDLDASSLLQFSDKDRALEWCEDVLLGKHAALLESEAEAPLEDQYICEGLSADEMAHLYRIGRRRTFPAGQVIFRAGDPGDSFYMVLSGLVDILIRVNGKRERRLVTIRSGMSFGEFAMVTEQARSAEARAVMGTTCYEISCGDIHDDLKTKILVAVAKELSRRLSKEAREMQVLGGRR
jgi:glutaminase